MSLSNNFPTIKPSLNLDFANTKRLDPRVTFTRSTTGTYYDGVTTAMAEQNLVLNSSLTSGTTSWGGSTNVLTLNYGSIAAPDGTFTAIRCQPVLTTSFVEQAVAGFNVGGTKSIWARTVTGTANAVLLNYSSGDPQVFALTTTWQRFTVTVTNSTIYDYFFLFDARSGSHTATDFLIWAPQAENRSTATAYTATTTQPITNYIPVLLTAAANVPRFDHNPTTDESLGLLIEEQRTNLALYSEQFDNGYWIKGSSSVTANMVASPDGTVNADGLISAASGSGASGVFTTISGLSGGATYTMSCYIKSKGANWTQLIAVGTGGSQSVTRGWFNISTGVVGTINNTSSAGTIQNAGNGWYRCSMIVPALTTTAPTIYFACANGDGIDAFTNDGWSGLYLWGAQLEAGGFATSYIATTAASATRNADLATMTGTNFSSWFNAGQGTFVTQFMMPSPTGQIRRLWDIENTNTNTYVNLMAFNGYSGSDSIMYFEGTNSGTGQFAINTGSFAANTSYRVAMAYQVNDFATSTSGGTVQTDINGVLPQGLNALWLGSHRDANWYTGYINKFAYYPVRVTNAQLQALSS